MTDLSSFDQSARCFDEDVDTGIQAASATASIGGANCIIDGNGNEYCLEIRNCRLNSITFEVIVETDNNAIGFSSGESCSIEGSLEAGKPGGWFKNREPTLAQHSEDISPNSHSDISDRILSNVESTILNEKLQAVNDSSVELKIDISVK